MFGKASTSLPFRIASIRIRIDKNEINDFIGFNISCNNSPTQSNQYLVIYSPSSQVVIAAIGQKKSIAGLSCSYIFICW
jgi:hypothetical protein